MKQPILTQYCDGQKVSCPSWMTQWGSKSLGDQGYSAIEILRYFYGSNMYINTAEAVSGIPASWPGYNIGIGSSGQNVYQIQKQLDPHRKGISGNSVYCAGWNIRTKDKGGRGKISGCIRTSGIRCGGLQYMV